MGRGRWGRLMNYTLLAFIATSLLAKSNLGDTGTCETVSLARINKSNGAVLQRCGPTVQTLDLDGGFFSRSPPLSQSLVDGIIRTCSNARALELKVSPDKVEFSKKVNALSRGLPKLKHMSFSGDTDAELFSSIYAKKLTSLAFGFYPSQKKSLRHILESIKAPSLKVLTLRGYVMPEAEALDNIRDVFPALESIYLTQSGGVFEGISFLHFDANQGSIKTCRINYSKFARIFQVDFKDPLVNTASFSAQLNAIHSLFESDNFADRFNLQYPNVEGVDFFLGHYNSQGFYKVLSGMTKIDRIVLGIESETPVNFPETDFAATSLAIDVFAEYPKPYLTWVSGHFLNLKELYVKEPVTFPDAEITFPSLEMFHSGVAQPIEFWRNLIQASPNLKQINSPDFVKFKAEFPSIETHPWSGIELRRDEDLKKIYLEV